MVFIGKNKIFNQKSFFSWKSAKIPGFDILKNRKIQNWKIKKCVLRNAEVIRSRNFLRLRQFRGVFQSDREIRVDQKMEWRRSKSKIIRNKIKYTLFLSTFQIYNRTRVFKTHLNNDIEF